MNVTNQDLLITILLCFMYFVLISGLFIYFIIKHERRENSKRKSLNKAHTDKDDSPNN